MRKKITLGRMLFGNKKDMQVDVLAEEAMESQFHTIIRRLFSKPVNTIATAVFCFFLIFVLVGPMIWPLDENYQDMTQQIRSCCKGGIRPAQNEAVSPISMAQWNIFLYNN